MVPLDILVCALSETLPRKGTLYRLNVVEEGGCEGARRGHIEVDWRNSRFIVRIYQAMVVELDDNDAPFVTDSARLLHALIEQHVSQFDLKWEDVADDTTE